MLRKLIILAALLMGCNSTEPEKGPTLTPGTYQYKESASDGYFIVQFELKKDGTYTSRIYVTANDGSMDCAIGEVAGKWAVFGDALKMSDKKARSREDCATAFPDWSDYPSTNEQIREITSSGFELYLSSDEDFPARWVKFTKL